MNDNEVLASKLKKKTIVISDITSTSDFSMNEHIPAQCQ